MRGACCVQVCRAAAHWGSPSAVGTPCRAEDAPEVKRPFPLKLVPEDKKGRTWVFSFASQADRAAWASVRRVALWCFFLCVPWAGFLPRGVAVRRLLR